MSKKTKSGPKTPDRVALLEALSANGGQATLLFTGADANKRVRDIVHFLLAGSSQPVTVRHEDASYPLPGDEVGTPSRTWLTMDAEMLAALLRIYR